MKTTTDKWTCHRCGEPYGVRIEDAGLTRVEWRHADGRTCQIVIEGEDRNNARAAVPGRGGGGEMKTSEARADAIRRLTAAGVPFKSVKARTVHFGDLARGGCVFVEVDTETTMIGRYFADVPKPSAGGYIQTYA